MQKKWKIAFPFLALVALVSIVVAACGSDEDEAPMPTPTAAPTEQAQLADIVDTAVAAGSFTTLAAALEAADLVDTLKGPGPFTVLAPTDEAFAALPAGTVEALLADPDRLRAILTYHVIAGEVPSSQVVQLSEATTVNGQPVEITVDGNTVLIGDARVTIVDVQASNGIIHVIDKVLIPAS
jgi:uncharacterized surface protein with fasciclin (FAS1) repeats